MEVKGLSGSAKCRHRGRGVHLLEVQDGGSRIVEQVHVGDSPWAHLVVWPLWLQRLSMTEGTW